MRLQSMYGMGLSENGNATSQVLAVLFFFGSPDPIRSLARFVPSTEGRDKFESRPFFKVISESKWSVPYILAELELELAPPATSTRNPCSQRNR